MKYSRTAKLREPIHLQLPDPSPYYNREINLDEGAVVELVSEQLYFDGHKIPCYLCWVDSETQHLIPINGLRFDKDEYLNLSACELQAQIISRLTPILVPDLLEVKENTPHANLEAVLNKIKRLSGDIVDMIYDLP